MKKSRMHNGMASCTRVDNTETGIADWLECCRRQSRATTCIPHSQLHTQYGHLVPFVLCTPPVPVACFCMF